MKMKKILLLLVLLMSTLVANSQTRVIDVDYLKVFDLNVVHIDYNQDYKAQANEVYEFDDNKKAQIYIDYKSYGKNVNTLYYKIIFYDKGRKEIFKKKIRNVLLLKTNDGITVGNQLQELQFGVVTDSCKSTLFISNPALIMEY